MKLSLRAKDIAEEAAEDADATAAGVVGGNEIVMTTNILSALAADSSGFLFKANYVVLKRASSTLLDLW